MEGIPTVLAIENSLAQPERFEEMFDRAQVWCSVVQHGALRCSVLQGDAVYCSSVLQCVP